MLEANRKPVQEQWDALNRGDLAAAAAYFAEDTGNHVQSVGRAGVLAVLNDIQTTIPDVQFKVIEAIAEGE
jgi:hypothetical protein